MAETIEVNQEAPDFTLFDMDLKQIRFRDFSGKKVVLAFYPGAFTSVCTKEMCTFRDSLVKLNSLNAQVIGISVNDPFSNKAFSEANGLNFPLLSDYNRVVTRLYGIEAKDFVGLTGYSVSKRSIFISDSEGIIRYKWITEDPGREPNYDDIVEQLKNII